MRYGIKVYIFLLAGITASIQETGNNRCGGADWIQYLDSKCLKLIKTYVSGEDASIACREIDPYANTVTIHSSNEQAFVANYLYNDLLLTSSVWIGLNRKTENTFIWSDNSSLTFSNWGADSPSNTIGKDCVEMISDFFRNTTVVTGQWRDTSCESGKFVLCEKLQSWSVLEMQRTIIRLIANPVPMGFIYTQLKGQPEPSITWPTVTWTDVSEEYAGLFFRVVGEQAESFGKIQSPSSPRLSKVQYHVAPVTCNHSPTTINPGTYSTCIWSGYDEGRGNGLSFLVTDVETKPINTAMRIWKRTG